MARGGHAGLPAEWPQPVTHLPLLREGVSLLLQTGGVQPVNTRLSGFVCLVKRGALGPDSSSLYFTRNPFVCHFMRNPERWRCRGRAVAPVWVKRATSPSSRGSLGVHGVFPEQGLLDLAQCSFLADERDSSSLPKAP